LKAKENACFEVVCNGSSWILKERNNANDWRHRTNGCVKYWCDNTTGLKSESIKTCEVHECHTAFCNESSGSCEWKKVSGYDELKKQENKCFEVVCNGQAWILRKTQNASDWEKKTGGCLKYECNNETGQIKIVQECAKADPCYVGHCNESTAKCDYVKKPGYDELKKQENKCYEVVCGANNEWTVEKKKEVSEWEDRKSKCRIYKCVNDTGLTSPSLYSCDQGPGCHTGKCNEVSGDCVYTKINGYNELVKQENHCYEVACDGTKWAIMKRKNATEWENKTDECRRYQCSNEKGPVSWSICNSTRNVGRMCVNGKCVPITCPDGQYQFYGNCYNCSAVLSCATCSNGTSCLTCKTGYKLNSEGICKYDCEGFFMKGCSECNSKKCLKCEAKECCTFKKFYWDDNSKQCIDPAEKFGIGCLEAEGDKCSKCTAATCCEDKQFFNLTSAVCESCSSFDENCSKCNGAGCLSCDGNMIVDTDGVSCKTCTQIYGEGCKSCSQTECSAVEDGYVLIGSMSKNCSSLFGECDKCNSTGCEQCSNGYENFDGFCKKCSEVFGEGCSQCDVEGAQCTQCANSKLTLINGVCSNCSIAYGEGCSECGNGVCTGFKPGFFIDKGIAIGCDAIPDEFFFAQTRCYMGDVNVSHDTSRIVSRDNGNVEFKFNGEDYSAECERVVRDCASCVTSNGKITCEACKEGYVLYGGVCKSCSELHGSACTSCSVVHCNNCSENNVLVSGACHSCDDLNPRCSVCSSADYCTKCKEGFNYIEVKGNCLTCPIVYGIGCTECNETNCISCTQDSCCPAGTKIIKKDDKRICGTCGDLMENCANCTETQCVGCINNLIIDTDSHTCKKCSDLFFGCSECNSDMCKACKNTTWILTENGCAHEEAEPEDPHEEPSSSSSPPSRSSSGVPPVPVTSASKSSASSHSSQNGRSSQPVNPSPKSSGGKTNVGMIVGIVIGVVAAAAIIAFAVYCVVTSGPKRGKIDPVLDEEEGNYVSMSVL